MKHRSDTRATVTLAWIGASFGRGMWRSQYTSDNAITHGVLGHSICYLAPEGERGSTSILCQLLHIYYPNSRFYILTLIKKADFIIHTLSFERHARGHCVLCDSHVSFFACWLTTKANINSLKEPTVQHKRGN